MKFFRRLVGRRGPSSREIAKERLELVLTYDRTNLSPSLLETLKNELIAAISRHVDIDVDGVEVTLTRSGVHSRLRADIPLLSSRRSSGHSREHRL